MIRVGAEAGSGSEQDAVVGGALEEAGQTAFVELSGQIEEEEGRALRRGQTEPVRGPGSDLTVELPRLRRPLEAGAGEGSGAGDLGGGGS